MAIDAELARLLDSAGLTGEDREKAEAAFNVDALGKVLKDGVMMRSDYSRKQDELAAHRKQLEANWKKANEEYIAMQRDLDATKAEKDEAAKELKDAKDKLIAAEQAAANAPKPPDLSGYLTREQFQEELKKAAAGMTAYSGEAMETAEEIASLTGSKVGYKKVLQEAQASGKTPAEWAEEAYQLSAKRAEFAKAARDKEIADARAAERAAVLAEMANPATRTMAESTSPFYTPKPSGNGEGVQPWDMKEPAADEVALLNALKQAHAG